ncbi:M23 family metallopeptidase [Flavobacterium sp.]|jgi:murein DD-endopeptidase MepM/ murein hydrolase activator NlpD|uniref:M23 family metallopeptidase n=1 Tax=Flavobacterium sp. TaxID=239 RepID=UPI0025C3864A|nr:M23 family metallopeptidase [Flavobacterium sp.]
MKKLIAIYFLFTTAILFAQYPKDYFRSPLDIPINLSGTFGELRTNHFHSGLDIRTNNVEGLPVYAAADGYVSRIKVSVFGYGKAIYITHPNGYTSVYGHLQKYEGKIEEYIKNLQYKEKNYEVETYLYPTVFPVKKGDIIAYSGNSGGSAGPHLHFEFRDTYTERIINPMAFGMNRLIRDDKAPEVSSVMVYPMNDSTMVNKSNAPIALTLLKQPDGSYLSNKVYTNGVVGFAINSYDQLTNIYNKNGVYKVQAFLNGTPHFGYQFDTFAFDESRHINYFIDFKKFKLLKQRYQKLFSKVPYPLSLVQENKKMNGVQVKKNNSYNYKIEVSDYHGNKTIVNIPLEYKDEPLLPQTSKGKYFIKAKNDYNFEFETASVYFPPNLFYENCFLNIEETNGVLLMDSNYEAMQSAMTISFDISKLSEEEQKKAFIAGINGYQLEYNSSFRKGNTLSAKIKSFGKFKVALDTIPPRVFNPNFVEGSNVSKLNTLTISITDMLSGIDSFNAYLNDEWILMEYDYKTKKLTHNISDGKIKSGLNAFKLIVTDKLNNNTIFTSNFTY